MNRRKFVSALGAGTVMGLAGCSASEKRTPIRTQTEAEHTDVPPEEREMLSHCYNSGLKECGKSWVTVRNINEITDRKLSVNLNVDFIERNCRVNVYRNIPTKDNPGTLGVEEVLFLPQWDSEEKEYKPSQNEPHRYRAVTRYEDQGKKLGSYDFKNPKATRHGASNPDEWTEKKMKFGAPLGQLDVSIPKQPTGIPVTYTFERVSLTRDGHPRRIESETQPILRLPSGEYMYVPRGHIGEAEGAYLGAGFREKRHSKEETEDTYDIQMVFATSPSRFSMSKKEYNRVQDKFMVPIPYSAGIGMWNAALLRPWSYSLSVPKQTVEKQQQRNNRAYMNSGNTNELANISRIQYDETFRDHPIIQKVAKDLRKMAGRLGFLTQAQQTRVAADFVQNIPYRFGLQNSVGSVKPPVETLVNGGDCEDKGLLLYSLLSQDVFDVDPVMAFIEDAGQAVISDSPGKNQASHIGVGVDILNSSRCGFTSPRGKFEQFGKYVYVETSTQAPLGWCNENYGSPTKF